jgi:putative endonuclease
MWLPFWRRAEIDAARYVRSLGYRVVASGYRVREGEVDLIAWDGEVLVFIEVKSRVGKDAPEAAVGLTKQRRIIRAAHAYMSRYGMHDHRCRFDIVTVNQIDSGKRVYKVLQDAFRPSPDQSARHYRDRHE